MNYSAIAYLSAAAALLSFPLYAHADDEEETTDLDEFVVVATPNLVSSDGATLTYNVTDDPEASSSNILDILRKVPGVSVDAEDNVKVNGQSSFKILLNGREDPMLKGDIKTVLKSLPAATIRKIEVISEPGAKYEAEGVGGILNIVTDRSRSLSGFMTQLGVWANAYNVGGYVNGRTKIRNVMLDANVSYNNGRVWPRSQKSEKVTDYLGDMTGNRLTTSQKNKSGWDYTGVNLNMSWEPDTLNLFTLSANYGYNSWNNHGYDNHLMTFEDTRLWSLNRDFTSSGRYNGVGVTGSYQHNFNRDDNNLVLSYEFDYGNSDYATTYYLMEASGAVSETPYSSNKADVASPSHIIQLDYSNKFSPKHLLEAGAKANLNTNRSFNDLRYGDSEATATVDEASTVKLSQPKNIYAVYGSYTGSFDKWSVKAGLRYEHTYLGLRYKIGDYSDFTSRLNDLVPNTAVSYNITSGSSLRLAYQMRISRPDISQLNPFVNDLTPGTISYGNPDLKSEKGHTVSLAYSNYDHPFTGGVKVSYRYVSNGVNDVLFVRDGVINSTFANIGRYNNFMLDANFDWKILQDLQWGCYLSTSYMDMRAESEMLTAKNHGWQTTFDTNVSYTLPAKWRLSGYFGLFTPWIDLQGRGKNTTHYYGVGASKSWFKDDALTLSVSVANFIDPIRHVGFTQDDETLRFRYEGRYNNWNAGVSLTFKFGGLTASVKRTAANIEKEEKSSSGGNKGGN